MSNHDDVRPRLPAFVAGLLDEAQDSEVARHLLDCAECSQLAESLAISPAGAGVDRAHIPAGVLARWPKALRELRGLERDLISAHLKTCEECRGALRVLGHAPTMLAAEPPSPTEVTRVKRATHGRGGQWLLGGWAALATAAAFVFATMPGPIANRPLESPGSSRRPDAATSRPALAESSAARGTLDTPPRITAGAPRVKLTSVDRGALPETTLIQRPPGDYVLLVAPLLSAPAESVSVVVRNARGIVLGRSTLQGEGLVNDGVLLRMAGLPNSTLSLELEWKTTSGTIRKRAYALRIAK